MLYDRRWDAEGFAYLHLDIRICKKCLIYLEICIILYFAFSTAQFLGCTDALSVLADKIFQQIPPDQTVDELRSSSLSSLLTRYPPTPQQSENNMSDSVGQYLNEIGLVPLLTAAEERELSQIIEKGVEARERLTAGEKGVELKRADRKAAEAKDRFIRANLRLVVSVARRYPLPAGMELLDLIQEGNLGLEHAVDKFDWRKGFKFSTYATFWIRQAIGRALDQKASLVRLPGDRSASLRAALRQVSGDGDELDEEHARLHRLTTPTSLDRTIGDDDSNELVDLLPDVNPGPEQAVMEEARETMVYDLLNVLDDRARYAVEQRFGLQDGRKRSYREVGEELGVTAEAARRLVKRAVNIVRESAPDQMDIDAA